MSVAMRKSPQVATWWPRRRRTCRPYARRWSGESDELIQTAPVHRRGPARQQPGSYVDQGARAGTAPEWDVVTLPAYQVQLDTVVQLRSGALASGVAQDLELGPLFLQAEEPVPRLLTSRVPVPPDRPRRP